MTHGIQGWVAIVTEVAFGIGKAWAATLARAGAHVVLADLDETAITGTIMRVDGGLVV